MTPSSPPGILSRALRFLSSLQLTVGLLAVAMVLIFFATIDQANLGINEVVRIYFRQWISYYDLRLGGGWDETLKAVIPPKPVFRLWMPGGYLIGTVFLINLVAAHSTRFKLSWKKSGITVIHAGIVLVLLGELFTGLTSRETLMTIDEGATVNYSVSNRRAEIAFVDRSNPQREKHIVIPQSRVEPGAQLSPPELPFRVEVVEFYPNARLAASQEDASGEGWKTVQADRGAGVGLRVQPTERAKQMNEIDLPFALIRLHEGSQLLGTWAVSLQMDILNIEQRVPGGGKSWDLTFRGERSYKPFSLTLRDFQHNKYPGTEIAKDFSSFVTLTEKGLEGGRDFRIWMNHPLRHGGYTFYQHQFQNADQTTVLQVVKNPSWLIPYIACTMVFVGLAMQFGLSLHTHVTKKRAKTA